MANDAKPDKPTSQPPQPQAQPQVRPAQIPNVDPGLITEVVKGEPEPQITKIARPAKK